MNLALLALAAAMLVVAFVSRHGMRFRGALALALALALAGSMRRAAPTVPAPVPIAPARDVEFAGSGACRSCHPGEHASWSASYHSSMTAVASPKTVLGPFDDRVLESRGRRTRLWRRGDEYWVTLPDPDVEAHRQRSGLPDVPEAAAEVERRVTMTTGSHHYQAYWVDGARGNELWQVPWVYLLDDARFIPRDDAFIQPPGGPPRIERWNSNCIQCHSVAGAPRHDEPSDTFASNSAELGIACEACHGPSAAHARAQRDPVQRYAARFGAAATPHVTNPASLDPARSSQVCGQCHSYSLPRDEARWWDLGFSGSYRPGDALDASRLVLDYSRDRDRGLLGRAIEGLDSVFWPDGAVRVGGREYNGLVASACHTRGEGEHKLGCLNCHALHDSDPDAQLRRDAPGDAACTKCHGQIAAAPAAHTHHAPDGPGSGCLDCHMPHTAYALLSALRSHRIDSPNAQASHDTGKPNACNLCHLDRSLAWTAKTLSDWYGAPSATLRAEHRDTPAAAVWLLTGDAAARAIVAWHLGWEPAARASDRARLGSAAAELLVDPYSAVRYVAFRALGGWSELRGLPGDFLDAPPALARSRRFVQERMNGRPPESGSPRPSLDTARVDALLRMRDHRPVMIAE